MSSGKEEKTKDGEDTQVAGMCMLACCVMRSEQSIDEQYTPWYICTMCTVCKNDGSHS